MRGSFGNFVTSLPNRKTCFFSVLHSWSKPQFIGLNFLCPRTTLPDKAQAACSQYDITYLPTAKVNWVFFRAKILVHIGFDQRGDL